MFDKQGWDSKYRLRRENFSFLNAHRQRRRFFQQNQQRRKIIFHFFFFDVRSSWGWNADHEKRWKIGIFSPHLLHSTRWSFYYGMFQRLWHDMKCFGNRHTAPQLNFRMTPTPLKGDQFYSRCAQSLKWHFHHSFRAINKSFMIIFRTGEARTLRDAQAILEDFSPWHGEFYDETRWNMNRN